MAPFKLGTGKWSDLWGTLEAEECSSNLVLNYNTIEAAIRELRKHFNMYVCDGTDQ